MHDFLRDLATITNGEWRVMYSSGAIRLLYPGWCLCPIQAVALLRGFPFDFNNYKSMYALDEQGKYIGLYHFQQREIIVAADGITRYNCFKPELRRKLIQAVKLERYEKFYDGTIYA